MIAGTIVFGFRRGVRAFLVWMSTGAIAFHFHMTSSQKGWFSPSEYVNIQWICIGAKRYETEKTEKEKEDHVKEGPLTVSNGN